MGIKYGALFIGMPLVALGTRFLCQGFESRLSLFAFSLGLILFLFGQTVARFEDFPFTRHKALQLKAVLLKRTSGLANNLNETTDKPFDLSKTI